MCVCVWGGGDSSTPAHPGVGCDDVYSVWSVKLYDAEPKGKQWADIQSLFFPFCVNTLRLFLDSRRRIITLHTPLFKQIIKKKKTLQLNQQAQTVFDSRVLFFTPPLRR